jgi:hypothetical protein
MIRPFSIVQGAGGPSPSAPMVRDRRGLCQGRGTWRKGDGTWRPGRASDAGVVKA